MFTILKIIWNNTALVSFFEFNIREAGNAYDYFVRIIGHVVVLIFFLVIFVIGIGGVCLGVVYDVKEDWKGALFSLCIMLPLMSLGLFVWYQYVIASIKEIRKNYLLWRKK